MIRTVRPDSEFARALALSTLSDGILATEIVQGWDVRGIPHGGYLLALVSEAMAVVLPQADPVTISATYLAPPIFARAELHVEPIRIGKRQSTAAVRLVQDGIERVRAVGTFGTLPTSDPTYPAGLVPVPLIPPPEHCHTAPAVALAEGETIELHRRLELRLDPGVGWIDAKPSGVAEVKGWLRLADGAEPDPAALLLFSDGMPPSMFEATGRVIGHVPTMQLTTHLFAKPQPGWVLGRFHTRIANGSLVDEDGDLWDSAGRLVATTRQLALLMPPR